MTALITRRTLTHVMAPLVVAGALLPGSGALAVEGRGRAAERFYPAARAPKEGLVVYLDGDGQEIVDKSGGDDGPGGLTGPRGIVSAAGARGYDVLAVRSPVSDRWWTDDTKANRPLTAPVPSGLTHAQKIDYLRDAIEAARTERGARTQNLWLVGYSGGSEFITEFFFPAYANSMKKGGFVVFGGGDVPAGGLRADSFSAASKATLSLNWVTGTADTPKPPERYDGIGHAESGHRGYVAAGFGENAQGTWLPGYDHERVVSVFGDHVAAVLDAYGQAAQ